MQEAPAAPTPFDSYRTFDRAGARARVLNGVSEARAEEIHPSSWFERWWLFNLQYDSEGARRTPPIVRAPSGVSQDYAEYWSQGKPTWTPENVTARTLVVVGEWDRNTPPELARTVHAKLTNARSRELAILPQGTHFTPPSRSAYRFGVCSLVIESGRNPWSTKTSVSLPSRRRRGEQRIVHGRQAPAREESGSGFAPA